MLVKNPSRAVLHSFKVGATHTALPFGCFGAPLANPVDESYLDVSSEGVRFKKGVRYMHVKSDGDIEVVYPWGVEQVHAGEWTLVRVPSTAFAVLLRDAYGGDVVNTVCAVEVEEPWF